MHTIDTNTIKSSNGYFEIPCGSVVFYFPDTDKLRITNTVRKRFHFSYVDALLSDKKPANTAGKSQTKKYVALLRMEKIVSCKNARDYARIFSEEMRRNPSIEQKWKKHPQAVPAARHAIHALLIHWGEYLEGREDWHQDGYEYLCDLLLEFSVETEILRLA